MGDDVPDWRNVDLGAEASPALAALGEDGFFLHGGSGNRHQFEQGIEARVGGCGHLFTALA